MVKLNNTHRAVARYIALGLQLSEVCNHLGLNYESWRQTVNQPLFKEEVKRIQSEIENRMIEDAVTDPVVARLKMSAVKASELLVAELSNHEREDGASATSRIKAATEILNRAGYSDNQQVEGQNIIFLELSPEKLSALQPKKIEKQPDKIKGN